MDVEMNNQINYEIEGIKFKYTTFDLNNIESYNFPKINEKVITFKNGINENNIYTSNTMDYLIHFSNWNNFVEFGLTDDMQFNCLIFDELVNNIDILNIIKKFFVITNKTNFSNIMNNEFAISDNINFSDYIIYNTQTMIIENKINSYGDCIILPPDFVKIENVTIINTNNNYLCDIDYPIDINNKIIIVLNDFVEPIYHYHNVTKTIKKYSSTWATYKIFNWISFNEKYFSEDNSTSYRDNDDIEINDNPTIFLFEKNTDYTIIHHFVKDYIFSKYCTISDIHDYIIKFKYNYDFNNSIDITKGITFNPNLTYITNYSHSNYFH